MPHFTSTRRVHLSALQAFAIAADVNVYKDFLPLLKRSLIRGERVKNGDTETFDADLMIAVEKLNIRESFTSHVTTDLGNMTVTALSSDGPVKALKAVWKITSITDTTSDVTITLDYTLKNMMLQMLAGGLMEFATQKIMHAFEERGRAIYGTSLS
jgi:coenzyme Q-binding protein COQ10